MATVVGAGSLAVHQLRYLLWYGHGSDNALSTQGHAYLTLVGPLVVAAGVLSFAGYLDRLARGARASAPRFGRLWAFLGTSLVTMYCVQESVEGLLSSGHPGGVDGVLGHGGWLSAPLSVAIGLAVAVVLRAATSASELLPTARPLRPRLPAAPASLRASASPLPRREPSLAAASARAPPVASA
jgi:hypothetical protein